MDLQEFKRAFLTKCAKDGLTEEQIHARLDQMEEKLADGSLAKSMSMFLFPLTLAGLGAAGGYALASATRPPVDPKILRMNELIAEYRRSIDQLERAQRRRDKMT